MTSPENNLNVYKGEAFKMRMMLQARLMAQMRPDREEENSSGIEWSELYSGKFEKLFNEKIVNEPDFLEKCKDETFLKNTINMFEVLLVASSTSEDEGLKQAA
jgi:hypothetical protein